MVCFCFDLHLHLMHLLLRGRIPLRMLASVCLQHAALHHALGGGNNRSLCTPVHSDSVVVRVCVLARLASALWPDGVRFLYASLLARRGPVPDDRELRENREFTYVRWSARSARCRLADFGPARRAVLDGGAGCSGVASNSRPTSGELP